MNISILLLTHNEEINIAECLAALTWCDDIVVVDSGSSDRTLDIVRSFDVRVLTRAFDDFAGQRNWGLENGDFRHEWVLHLDADEIVTPEFRRALAALKAEPGLDAYRVPSKLMLFGRWLRHAGMYPTYQVRLGHRERLRFIQVGHGQREDLPPSRVGVFDEPYLHFSFSHGMARWLAKHIRYAKDEADLIVALREGPRSKRGPANDATSRRRAAKVQAARIPVILRPLARFFYIYVVKRGFRDGTAGLAYATMLSVYEGMTALLVIEAVVSRTQAPRERASS
jgi:glycosyltransferase involved in cell wall biosynthesis